MAAPLPLADSKLFKRLESAVAIEGTAKELPGNVHTICDEAGHRLRRFSHLHNQYTLHDDVHCRRVVDLMAEVLGVDAVNRLPAVEATLLILSAYLHDIGMVPEDSQLEAIRDSAEWKVHTSQWTQDHANYAETRQRLADPNLGELERGKLEDNIAQLASAMMTDFVRVRHGEFSARYVVERYGTDPRLVVGSTSLARVLATICRSHVLPATDISADNGLSLDTLIGTQRVNTQRIAYVLRLADILDFDRERTPDSLYRSISFKSEVSLTEWQKHRGIDGWSISPDRIVFNAGYEHPAYERACREFMNWIDVELLAAKRWSRSLPASNSQDAIELPDHLDRSQIGPVLDPITSKPAYQFFDLEFSLSRDELVKLLMTDKLYSDKNLFVRELLQNALDALRYRTSLAAAAGMSLSDQRVTFSHRQDAAGFHIVTCTDNGVGMDASIIRNFLTRAGRSYYRSPQFEQERTAFKAKGCDFDPCARFGIGFLSCFMFGDEITIKTRRDYGPGRERGEPLVVEVAGLGGIIAVRAGEDSQPIGTTVEVRSRRASRLFDFWDDPVRLQALISSYAVATEYPITVTSTLNGETKEISISTVTRALPHPLEDADLKSIRVFQRSFADVDERLGGEVRYACLAHNNGIPTLDTPEARWRDRAESTDAHKYPQLARPDGTTIDIGNNRERGQVACDGILICGHRGRNKVENYYVPGWGLNMSYGRLTFLMDARSTIKPNLTPARTPPQRGIDEEPTWTRLYDVAAAAVTLIFDEVASSCEASTDPSLFWQIASIDTFSLKRLAASTCFKKLRFPFKGSAEVNWIRLSDCEALDLEPVANGLPAIKHQGCALYLPPSISRWETQPDRPHFNEYILSKLILQCSQVRKSGTGLQLELLREPLQAALIPRRLLGGHFERIFLVPFDAECMTAFAIAQSGGLVNLNHPLVERVVATDLESLESRSLPDRLFAMLAYGISNLGGISSESPDPKRASWLRRLGRLAGAINWETVPTALHPPYCWITLAGVMETLTLPELLKLADIEVPADEE